jgi:hypothetical protein
MNSFYRLGVITFLQSGTLVGVLPVPHPLFVRKFNYNEGVRVWFKGYMWGVIYLRHVQPQPSLFVGTNVKLFTVITADGDDEQ